MPLPTKPSSLRCLRMAGFAPRGTTTAWQLIRFSVGGGQAK